MAFIVRSKCRELNHVNSDNIFKYLKNNGVKFYNTSITIKKMPYKPVSEEGNYYNLSN